MKKVFKAALMLVIAAALIAALAVGFAACDPKETPGALRVAAPEGTPALAIARLKTDNATLAGHAMTYEVVSPSLIAAEMSGGKADVVIMPVNAGANLIRQGADYRLISVAVNGSLFMVGSTDDGGAIEKADIAGSKVACIGQGATPGLVFEYVMRSMGLEIVAADKTPGENQVAVQYVADGPAAKTLLENDKVDFAVVGEPAATTFKNALRLNAELDMQAAWKDATGEETYPQAGLFVRTSLAADAEFISALFDALAASKEWVNSNPSEVGAFMKANLYKSAAFPAPSISRCAIDAEPLGEADKAEILAFLSAVMPKAGGTAVDWSEVTLFA